MKNFAEINRASTGAKKTFNFFEKLWEHGRTLRRVGLVLVMCLITIPQAWAYKITGGHTIYFDNSIAEWTGPQMQVRQNDSNKPVYEFTRIGTTSFYYKVFDNDWDGYDGIYYFDWTGSAWGDKSTYERYDINSNVVIVAKSTDDGTAIGKFTTFQKAYPDNRIYFDATGATGWGDKAYFRYGFDCVAHADPMTKFPGTASLFYIDVNEAYYIEYTIANNAGYTKANTVYQPTDKCKPTGDYEITHSLNYSQSDINGGASKITTCVITTPKSSTADGCDWYNYTKTGNASIPTQTVNVGSVSNGKIRVDYYNTSGEETYWEGSGGTSLTVPQSAIITVKAIPNVGYYNSALSVGGDAFAAGSTYTVTATTAISATFARSYPFIEGRFRIKNAARNSNITVGGQGSWVADSKSIPMEIDSENGRYVLHTYSTPAELKAAFTGGTGDATPYFYIKESSSSSTVPSGDGVAEYWATDEGSSYQQITAAGTANKKEVGKTAYAFTFDGNSGTTGYVVIYCDRSHIWYELEYQVSYKTNGSSSGSAPTDANYYFSGTSVTVKDNTGKLVATGGNVFAGWATSSGASSVGTGMDPGDNTNNSFTITGNTDLYPVWKQGYYLITPGGTTFNLSPTAPFLTKSTTTGTSVTINEVNFSTKCWSPGGATKVVGTAYTENNHLIYDTQTDNEDIYIYATGTSLYYAVFKDGVAYTPAASDTVSVSGGKVIKLSISHSYKSRLVLGGNSLKIGNIKVVKKGSALAAPCTAGYRLSFPGRPGTAKTTAYTIDGISLYTKTDMKFGDGSMKLCTAGTEYISFETTSAVQLQVKIATNKQFYVCTDKSDASTTGKLYGGTSGKTYNIDLVNPNTYYITGSGDDLTISHIEFEDITSCTAPSALAVSSITSSGATFTVTDENDANNYEIYVNTTGSAPSASTAATYPISGGKTIAVDDLAASTTYYAWARTKCDYFNKSAWVALTGNTFTTSAAGCAATKPGDISIGSLSGCSVTLTADGEPEDGDTWYWQESEDGEDTSESGATKDVTATGTYYIRSYNTSGTCWSDAVSVTVSASDLTPAAPSAFAKSSVTHNSATFSITAGGDASSYDLYYASGSPSTPTSGTSATTTVNTTTPTITSLTPNTTYKIWVRAICGSNKSSWVALSTTSFTTDNVYTVTYDGNDKTSGNVPTDAASYANGETVTVKSNGGSLTKDGYNALAYWNTADDGSGSDYTIGSGTFSMGTSNVILYAKWTQTISLDKNGGSNNTSATGVWNAAGPFAPGSSQEYTGHTLVDYRTSDGTTVLNTDGSFADDDVADSESDDYIVSGKWAHAAATTLYAHWKCNTPSITDNGNNTVSISVPSGTTVRYTIDGSTTPSSTTGTIYSGTFAIEEDVTVKAIAYQSGCDDSNVASQDCDYTPAYSISHNAVLYGSYTIQVGDGSPVGTSTISPAGTTISLAATPSSGYVLESWGVTGATVGNNHVASTTFTMPESNVIVAPTFKPMPNVYYYKDATHYTGSAYKNPEGDAPANTTDETLSLSDPWNLCNACVTGVTSVVVDDGTWDNKSGKDQKWVTSYIKLRPSDGGKITFTIAAGYKATIKMKSSGWDGSKSYSMKLNDSGDNISPSSGSMSGQAQKENDFALLTWSNLAAGAYTFKPTTSGKNIYISEIDIQTTAVPLTFVGTVEGYENDWSKAGNWSPACVPTSAHDVTIASEKTATIEANAYAKDLTVETGATLSVTSGATLSVNSLSLKGGWNDDKSKYDMPRVYISSTSTLTKAISTVNFDISVDYRNYYPFALPFDVPLSSVNYADPRIAPYTTYGSHFEIDEYNGQSRANNGGGSSNWSYVSSGTLKAGKGYIMSAKTVGGKAIIRFPMTVANGWTALGEQGTYDEVTKNVIVVTAYEKKEGETPIANKGWNLIGVPFMSCYTTSDDMYDGDGTATMIEGRFDYETGKWTEEDANVYVTVPTHDFTEFIQSPVSEAVLLPGWCFFVQVAETGNLKFLTTKEAASSSLPYEAPRREKAMPTVKTGIILSGADASDKTTILVSDKYNAADYEINADLEKMFGETGYTLATYSLSGETRLAYNALSNADAANIIPIGYRAPADGDYTFSINPRYAENGAFEHVNLIDYETGIMTDLLLYSYTFSTERTQLDTRFALNVVPRQNTPTDIENGASGINDANGPRKVLINDKMYIIIDGKMYDATGKAVK